MKIYLIDQNAFVDIGNGYMICIGTKKEVDEAKGARIFEMVQEAITMNRYRSIETSKGRTLN